MKKGGRDGKEGKGRRFGEPVLASKIGNNSLTMVCFLLLRLLQLLYPLQHPLICGRAETRFNQLCEGGLGHMSYLFIDKQVNQWISYNFYTQC